MCLGGPQRPVSVLLFTSTRAPRETNAEVKKVAIGEGFMLAKDGGDLFLGH